MKRLNLLILFVYCACAFAWAQYSDKELFAAYLKNDMTVWDKYLHSVSFEKATTQEKMRYLNYEYGYLGAMTEQSKDETRAHLPLYQAHLDALTELLPKATLLTYQSSSCAFEAMLNKRHFISKGLESFGLVKDAYEADTLNPLALSLRGNVDFYAPKAFGGNKQRALHYFRLACEIYEKRGDTQTNWNYVATRLCLIQCEDKLGHPERALTMAKRLLGQYPGFVYLRDTYIPDLENRVKK